MKTPTILNKGKTLQTHLFNQIKMRTNKGASMVDNIAELLHVSDDSAYRRIRGETLLNLEELGIICNTYHLSLDEILRLQNNGLFFNYYSVAHDDLDFGKYYSRMANIMHDIAHSENSSMVYAAMDVPIFQYFNFIEIILFKTFFWKKTIWEDPSMRDEDFKLNKLFDQYGEAISADGQKVLSAYVKLPSTEMWNEWTLVSTLRQIDFCLASGFFKDKKDCLLILEQLYKLIEHIELQATCGYKFQYGRKPEKKDENYKMYLNEILFLANCVTAQVGDRKQVFIIHEAINYLITYNEAFCDETFNWLDIQMRKAVLISKTSEKIRNSFFSSQYQKIEALMAKI